MRSGKLIHTLSADEQVTRFRDSMAAHKVADDLEHLIRMRDAAKLESEAYEGRLSTLEYQLSRASEGAKPGFRNMVYTCRNQISKSNRRAASYQKHIDFYLFLFAVFSAEQA